MTAIEQYNNSFRGRVRWWWHTGDMLYLPSWLQETITVVGCSIIMLAFGVVSIGVDAVLKWFLSLRVVELLVTYGVRAVLWSVIGFAALMLVMFGIVCLVRLCQYALDWFLTGRHSVRRS